MPSSEINNKHFFFESGFTESRHSEWTGPDTDAIKPQYVKEMRGRRWELSVTVCRICWFNKHLWLKEPSCIAKTTAHSNVPLETDLVLLWDKIAVLIMECSVVCSVVKHGHASTS
jgi:hypothetical protein